MNATLESFARAHRHLDEATAFQELLRRDGIRRWLDNDASRSDRLRQEFRTAWERAEPATAAPAPATAAAEAKPPAERSYLCVHCGVPEVRAHRRPEGVLVLCDGCDRRYDNLLDLIPVEAVGPLALLFGPGARANLVPAAGALALTGLYLALRWLRWA